MRLRLQELQKEDKQTQKLKAEQLSKDNWEKYDSVLHHQGLFYVLEIIQIELISKYHNNALASYFGIEKIQKLVA